MPIKKIIGFDVDDILNLVGLERRRPTAVWVLPAVGLMALGVTVGAGVGLMFAPSAGRRLRHDMGERLGKVTKRVRTELRKQGITLNAIPQR